MKLLLTSSLILVSVFLSGCGKPSSDQWHNYGNGMVNLANVSHIKGKINLAYSKIYDIEKEEYVCPNAEGGDWNNSLTNNDIEIVINALENAEENNCYWNIRVSAFIMFDDFKLELYKFPSTDDITNNEIDNIEDNLENALDYYQSIF